MRIRYDIYVNKRLEEATFSGEALHHRLTHHLETMRTTIRRIEHAADEGLTIVKFYLSDNPNPEEEM